MKTPGKSFNKITGMVLSIFAICIFCVSCAFQESLHNKKNDEAKEHAPLIKDEAWQDLQGKELNWNKPKPTIIPDHVDIFQGVSSYAYFGADKSITEELYNYIISLDFEKISKEQAEEEGNLFTRFSIYFLKGENRVLDFHIDKKGILWYKAYADDIFSTTNNETEMQFYRVIGDYSYDYIYEIYMKQKNKNSPPPYWQKSILEDG